MAFASNSGAGPMADINVTPLVDVMLVLLIIFMVTAPALSYQIQVDLPQRTSNPPPPPKDPPEPIRLRIEAGGTVTWNNTPIPLSTLQAALEVEAERAGADVVLVLEVFDAQLFAGGVHALDDVAAQALVGALDKCLGL